VCLAGAADLHRRMLRVGRLLKPERLFQVHPELRAFAVDFSQRNDCDWMVVTGARTKAQVAEKYAIGRTVQGAHAGQPGYPPMGQTVTNVASLEHAPHAIRETPAGPYSCAVDMQFLLPDGSLAPGTNQAQQDIYALYGAAAEAAGFVWGGSFRHLFDQAHVELFHWKNFPLV
jgi:hypothetical protein